LDLPHLGARAGSQSREVQRTWDAHALQPHRTRRFNLLRSNP
jgi:hypothetical protein